jgi:hypothetical protein
MRTLSIILAFAFLPVPRSLVARTPVCRGPGTFFYNGAAPPQFLVADAH